MKKFLRDLKPILTITIVIFCVRATAVPTYTTIYSFPFTGSPGCDLNSKPLEGSDGALYGTTHELHRGMPNYPIGSGIIYKINKDGTGYAVLHQFDETYAPHPAALIETSDGQLWGITTANYGTLFKMNKDGSGFTIVHTFNYPPTGNLLEGSDGAIYGAIMAGDVVDGEDPGMIYKIKKDGSGFTVVHHFPSPPPYDWTPAGNLTLIEGADGFLYGTSSRGGFANKGTVFRLRKDGTQFGTLYSFTGGDDGEIPHAGVIQASDGALYGTTGGFGFLGHGSVYKINTDGTGFTVLRSVDTSVPGKGLVLEDIIEGSDGALYVSGVEDLKPRVFKIGKDGSGYTILRDAFGLNDDSDPLGVVEGSDGVLYGTTIRGGDSGCGSVFKMSKSGTDYEVLRSFDAHGVRDIFPGPLIYGTDHFVYGASPYGGSNMVGAIYKLSASGFGFTVIYNFTGAEDGGSPSLFFQGSEGYLYGASSGGKLFRINPDGAEFQVIHQFGTNDGNAVSALIEGPDGLLYGSTQGIWVPASNGIGSWYSTLFKMNKDGSDFQTFYNVPGTWPSGPLNFGNSFAFVSGSDGYIYGERNEELFRFLPGRTDVETLFAGRPNVWTTPSFFEGSDGALYSVIRPPPSGDCPGCGSSLARFDKNGTNFTRLFNFSVDFSGYNTPRILEGPDGYIYGSTALDQGGSGTIFRIAKDGSGFAKLFSFPLIAGSLPYLVFTKGGQGDFFGVTTAGGDGNIGTIYKVHVPIWAPVLTAGSTWSSEVVLSWTSDDPRVLSFTIARRQSISEFFAPIATVGKDTREFHDTNASPSTTYSYVVFASSVSSGPSEYSNEATVTTPSQEYFATLVSVARCDGFVAEATKKANFGSMAFPYSTGPAAIRAGDTSLNQQVKGIVSFRTGELPDNATVISAKLLLKRGVMYGNPFASLGHCVVDVKSGSGFGTSPLLEPMDFQTLPGKRRVGIVNALGDESGWYVAQLDEKANGYIDKKGSTQFRIYFEVADNGDLAPDYIGWYSGECPVPENRPVLQVIYR